MQNADNVATGKLIARLLLVDDNKRFCKYTEKYFTHQSNVNDKYIFQMQSENVAANAIRRIQVTNPHVLILDQSFGTLQKETGEDIFWQVVEKFKDRINNRKLAIIFYSRSGQFVNSPEWQSEFITKGITRNVESIIRMGGEYDTPELLMNDVRLLIRGVIKPPPNSLYIGECDDCGLLFDFLNKKIYIGNSDNSNPLFESAVKRKNSILYLAENHREWCTLKEFRDNCWEGAYSELNSVNRLINYTLKDLIDEQKNRWGDSINIKSSNYIEKSRNQLRMRKCFSCICK